MKFSIKDFFSKRDQICSFLKKSLMENFNFCAVFIAFFILSFFEKSILTWAKAPISALVCNSDKHRVSLLFWSIFSSCLCLKSEFLKDFYFKNPESLEVLLQVCNSSVKPRKTASVKQYHLNRMFETMSNKADCNRIKEKTSKKDNKNCHHYQTQR